MSLRRFAELVIGFGRKYRDDIFIRTEVNIIILEVVYAALLLGVSITALFLLYREIVSGIAEVIGAALISSEPISAEMVMQELGAVRTRQIVAVAGIVFTIALLFGYLVARFALRPARDALSAQKQFIGNIAHELRTPLSIIKANTEVRLLDADVASDARAMHRSNLEELDRISNIINNLLSLNALIQPERVSFTDIDIVALAEQVVTKFKHLVNRKTLRLQVLADAQYYVHGNYAALEQILANLVGNALQHTERGNITVIISEDFRGQLEISVRDTGVGIKPEDLRHVFDPFYRGNRARTRSGGAGSGLGLAIVSELVRLHRGRISVSSAPGKGTSVVITLPSKSEGGIARAKNKISNVFADFSDTGL